MSILINENTKLIVQGITGRDGSFHTELMKEYGTNIVGGVTPGKGGEIVCGVPVFNTVDEAVEVTGANTSVIYVPAKFAGDALMEASLSKLELCVCITEGVPTIEVLKAYENFKKNNIRLIGPNCPGLISPGKCKIGILPGEIHKKGNIGVISRSGTLTYEIVKILTEAGYGQSTCIGIGGDPIIGTRFTDLLPLFENDPETDAIVVLGEIGGNDEKLVAEYFKKHMKKPLVAFIAGITAPPGRRMGHAGALVGGEDETALSKIKVLEDAGIKVGRLLSEIPGLLK